ncbi:YycH family regulatory protein [Lactobacillus sp. PV012]|uniref:YycH family regulatory protein n=1 Tax=Lactobacillus sp. PV012 TaxID=2594494 RepID=UPI00223EB902|nr:two-component system activity regulator YycH [Lactobacillus sp. PV012]QNQ81676.1 hypothetical protein FP433_00735 [Lactobacillus sp. PV012]
MKSKNKISDHALTIALVVMILTSLGLSGYIWSSDSRFTKIEQTSNQSPNKQVGQKSLREIYMPTKIMYYKGSQLYQVYAGRGNLPLQFSNMTQSLKSVIPEKIGKSKSEYDDLLKNQNYVQLTYPDQITISLFLTGLKKINNGQFNRFFVPVNGQKYIYLGNDADYCLYKIPVNKVKFDNFYQKIRETKTQLPVSLYRLDNMYLTFFEKSTSLPIYSYLTDHQADSYFVYRLLGTGSINQRNSTNSITYSNGVYERLIASKKNNDYEYVNYGETKSPKSVTDKLTSSLYYVRKIGLSEPDLHFFDADNNVLIYQNYVEEYPVFLTGKYNSRAKINFATNGLKINFNSLDLQIPIPNDGSKKKLQPTAEALNQLEAAGYDKSKISRIIVGYTSKVDNDKSARLVTLTPAYYVKINGKWQSINEWITQAQGKE